MLFYTTLLLTSFLLTLIVIGLKNLIIYVARVFFHFGKQNIKNAPTAHLGESRFGRNEDVPSSAWGRQSHAAPATLARTHPAAALQAPWGWRGNNPVTREQLPKARASNKANLNAYLAHKRTQNQAGGAWAQGYDRPERDSLPSHVVRVSAVSRKAKPNNSSIRKNDAPWGW